MRSVRLTAVRTDLFVCLSADASGVCDAETEFQCVFDSDCIPRRSVCNHIDNCGDNSDEHGCQYPPGRPNVVYRVFCNNNNSVTYRISTVSFDMDIPMGAEGVGV